MRLWTEIRRRVLAEGLSKRQACREYGLHWHTLTKILEHTEPPGYRQTRPRPKRKLELFLPVIHEILKQDQHAPRKQRHTAKRIFDRLRAADALGAPKVRPEPIARVRRALCTSCGPSRGGCRDEPPVFRSTTTQEIQTHE